MAITAQLDEVPQRTGIRCHENLRLGRVGEHAAGGLAGELAPERLVRLGFEDLEQLLRQLHVAQMRVSDRVEPKLMQFRIVRDAIGFDILGDRFIDVALT